MLDPRRVLVFRAVAASGSFSAAADALHLTQPSVSRSVAALEATLGLPLFVRRPEGVVLTEAGERLLARADVVAGHLERAAEELGALARGEEGAVRLGAFPTAAGSFVVDALRAVRRAHPGVEIALHDVRGTSGAALVEAGRLDVAVGFALEKEPGPSRAALTVTPLLREPLLAALPREHPLARRRRLRLEDLAGTDWVQGPGRLVERVCRRAGFEPRVVAKADATQPLVAAGVGVTLVPGLARASARADLRLVDLEDAPRRAVYAVTLRGRRLPAVDVVVDALRNAATVAK